VDRTEAERPGDRILALRRDVPQRRGLGEHAAGLRHDRHADRGHLDARLAALEQLDAEFVLEPRDGERERRLRDMHLLGRAPEAALLRDRDQVAQLDQRHPGPLTPAESKLAMPAWQSTAARTTARRARRRRPRPGACRDRAAGARSMPIARSSRRMRPARPSGGRPAMIERVRSRRCRARRRRRW
jgi:hypothetical protein